ncbi:hypothetical protein GW17_00028253 [Ensete ventricosum]|nr:hypothetical protein GW17_00028253 [Ensete ventricosum]
MQDRRGGNQERDDERTADAGGMTVLKYPGRDEEEEVVAEGFAFVRPTNSSTDDVEEAEGEEVFLLSIGPDMPWRRRRKTVCSPSRRIKISPFFLDPLSVPNSENPKRSILVVDTHSWASGVGGGPRRHACERIRNGRNSRPRLCRRSRPMVEPPDHKKTAA